MVTDPYIASIVGYVVGVLVGGNAVWYLVRRRYALYAEGYDAHLADDLTYGEATP